MTILAARAIVDGCELHWTERGSGSPLVILHGLADSQHTWRSVSELLAKRYRVLSLDLPGCGLSARPDASYSLEWHARLVDAWLSHLGIDECDVLGHSYGGGVALWLLLYRAKSIRRLALVSPGGLGTEVGTWLRLAAFLGPLEAGGQLLIAPITAYLTFAHGGELTSSERTALYRLNGCPGTGRAFTRTVRDVVNWRGQTRQLLQRVNEVPQLPSIALFWGELDRVIPIRHGEALAASLEHCSLWRLPNAGHFLHWQAPQALAKAILTYLDGPELPPAQFRVSPRSPARRSWARQLARVRRRARASLLREARWLRAVLVRWNPMA
jgi:pimeloyl-ACP methyl ester carboxylesterase